MSTVQKEKTTTKPKVGDKKKEMREEIREETTQQLQFHFESVVLIVIALGLS